MIKVKRLSIYMETNKTSLSNLDLSLFSYNRLIILIIIFIIVMFILFVTNRSGFNKYFGYQTLLITPLILLISFLIKELFIFKNNPSASRFSFLSQTNGATILLLLYCLLYSPAPPLSEQ